MENGPGNLSQIEVDLYGSIRLGLWQPNRNVELTDWWLFDKDPMQGTTDGIGHSLWERGNTVYELSNHLGNVLAIISDRKKAIDANSDDEIDSYEAVIMTANDYYPLGWECRKGNLTPETIGMDLMEKRMIMM